MHICMQLFFLLISTSTVAAEYNVASADDIARVSGSLKAGDTIVMADGEWKDQAVAFRARGKAGEPITFRAQTPGKVILSGKSAVRIDGEHLIISGLLLDHGQLTNDGFRFSGSFNRLTDTAVIGGNYKFLIHMYGSSNELDHCYLADKTNDNPTLQIEVEGKANNHNLHHNFFGPRPPLGRNGGETIRVGYSHQSMTNSGTLIEQNLFEKCDGEIEIISSKSCENVYRANTFRDCAGMLTLRHGNRCVVEGNFFIGHHKKGSGGIRIIGEDHVVINNYIEGVENGAFWITSGVVNSPLNAYFQAKRCVIAFNTVVDCRGPLIDLGAGIGTSSRTLLPENITIANNIFSPTNSVVLKGKEGEGYQWMGNLVAMHAPTEHTGGKLVDLKLVAGADGLWRPASDSPARGTAQGDFVQIKTDIDGQERSGAKDVGCDQASDKPILNRPLTAADVGPSWRK